MRKLTPVMRQSRRRRCLSVSMARRVTGDRQPLFSRPCLPRLRSAFSRAARLPFRLLSLTPAAACQHLAWPCTQPGMKMQTFDSAPLLLNLFPCRTGAESVARVRCRECEESKRREMRVLIVRHHQHVSVSRCHSLTCSPACMPRQEFSAPVSDDSFAVSFSLRFVGCSDD